MAVINDKTKLKLTQNRFQSLLSPLNHQVSLHHGLIFKINYTNMDKKLFFSGGLLMWSLSSINNFLAQDEFTFCVTLLFIFL